MLYDDCLASKDFSKFPDTYADMRAMDLAYFDSHDEPLTYEDFLPVSAAGIFKSNLRETEETDTQIATGNQSVFEAALGRSVLNMFDLYQRSI